MPDPNPNPNVNLAGSGSIPHVQRADGQFVPQQGSDAGEAKVHVANLSDGTADNNVGAAVSKTVKSGAGRLLSLSVRHAETSSLYLWVFDNTAASGTNLIIPTLIPAASHVVLGTDLFTTKGIAFSTGLTYGFSTSGSSYSAYGTAANCFATVVFQ